MTLLLEFGTDWCGHWRAAQPALAEVLPQHQQWRHFKVARGDQWKWINDVAYTDDKVMVVHVEHFASQGALVPQWLGLKNHDRSLLGAMAAEALEQAVAY